MTPDQGLDPQSPVFAHALAPKVAQPTSPWTIVVGISAAVLLGVIVFSVMASSRQAHERQIRAAAAAEAAKPPPITPVYAPPPPPPVTVVQDAQPPATPAPAPAATGPSPAAQAEATARIARLHAPSLVVDFSEAAAGAKAGGVPGVATATEDKRSAEERFADRVSSSDVDTAQASQMRNVAHMAPQGTIIPAVLETAINSDLPGSVRAVISRDVRGFDGTLVLIPRGSKLIGQYRSGVAVGQTRAFVVWSRILTPTGVSINVGSPAADRLGRGGLDGETDDHFFRRFGASILLSVMSAGLDAVSVSNGNNTSLVIGSQSQASRVAEIALQKQIDLPATIKVAQGTPLQVFVTRDLDFSSMPTVKP